MRERLCNRLCFVAADGQAALRVQSFVASLLQKVELLCARDRLWLRFCGWPSCFACAIDRGLLPRMTEVWLRDPRRLRVDSRFAQQILGSDVCVRNTRIIAPKLGSEVCAAKS